MTHQRGLHVKSRFLSALTWIFVFIVISATSLFGQATPWDQVPPQDPVTHSPLPPNPYASIPSVNGNQPGPYTRPTPQQTEAYINSNPSLRTLDPSLKQTLIYNQNNLWFQTPFLPNGHTNPFYQNGQITPNWYLPSTWTSTTMNWQGVQPNGFLPSVSPTTYSSWNSGSTPYNPRSYTPAYRAPVYQPNPPTPSRVVPNNSQQPSSLRPFQPSTPSANVPNNLLASRPAAVVKAIESGERALALSESAGDKVAQVANHAALAQLLVQQGKLDQAFMHLTVAETMAKTVGDPRAQINILQTKGAAYVSSGDFEKSLDAYREAMKLSRSLNDRAGQAELYASSGWVFQSLGNIPRALGCYDAAITLFKEVGNKDGEVRARIGMGSLYQALGEWNKASEQYMRAAPNASDEQHARMLVSVAEIHQSLNQPLDALSGYNKALSLLRPVPNPETCYWWCDHSRDTRPINDPSLEGAIWAGMGRAHVASHAYQKAQSDFEIALAKVKEAGNRAAEAGVIASIGELNYWIALSSPTINPKSRFTEALRNYSLALPMMREAGDRIGEIGILTNTGLVYDAWGQTSKALPYYLESLQKMDELETSARLEEFRLDLAGQSANLYQRAILLEASLHHMEEAFNLSERARARSFLDQLGNHRIDFAKHPTSDFSLSEEKLRAENVSLQRQLGQELAKPGPDVNPERTLSLRTRLSAVRKEYEDLVNQLKISNPEYASFLSISPLTLREAQKQLAPDVTVLSYYTTPEMTLAFVLTQDRFHVAKLSVSELELLLAVTTFLDFSGTSDMAPSLKPLYKRLITPVKSQLKTSRLAVVPYGVLHGLPFAALTPDGQHFLGDDYSVFYLPSVSVLPHIHARVKTGGSRALVLANDQEEGLPRLSYAEGEARAVASLWGSQPLLGEAATASMLRSKAGDYDIVHLIAHFDFDSQHPQSSRIILGRAKGNEGPLELNDVFGLDLRKTNLVVLSGCQSQRGSRTRGDDVLGLSRAFIYAGSPSVIASLWSVDDDATQQLMIAFYTHLKEGLSKAEALRAAQADVRHKYPNPFYWAGFVLTGDPGQASTSNLSARSTN